MSAQQKEDRLFENIYLSYFPKMKRFAQEYVISEQDAENIVQDMFAELWEKREMFTSMRMDFPRTMLSAIFFRAEL